MTSLGRRLALKALIGTPFAAGTIANAAAKEVLDAAGSDNDKDFPSGDNCPTTVHEPSHIERLFWKTREHDGAWVRKDAAREMSLSIASKKSWSPAFKEYVASRDAMEIHRAAQSERGMLEWLVSKGILPNDVLL